jgi:adenine-specific DNA-methyltransferase
MNNGAFFSKLRNFISDRASIEYMRVYEDSKIFTDAQTAVQIMVLRKGSKSKKFIVDLGQAAASSQNRTIFAESASTILKEFVGRTTLWHLGYEAVTGSLVWNQHKEELRRTAEAGTVPLIWAHNISQELEIVLNADHPKKPQFVSSENFWLGPAIVVNRITGSVGQGSLRCALIPEDFQFLAENHINVIRARRGVTQEISFSELIRLLRQPGINPRIQKLTGNTQLSCIELTHFLPLDYELEPTQSLTLF